jgi:hypothetical protein
MENREPVEYSLIHDARLLDFDVVGTSIEPTIGNDDFHVVIRMKTDDDLLEKAALGVMFTLAMLLLHDARPRGVSGAVVRRRRQLTIADFLEDFEYRAGALYYYADYNRGRCLKTTVQIHPDGRIARDGEPRTGRYEVG